MRKYNNNLLSFFTFLTFSIANNNFVHANDYDEVEDSNPKLAVTIDFLLNVKTTLSADDAVNEIMNKDRGFKNRLWDAMVGNLHLEEKAEDLALIGDLIERKIEELNLKKNDNVEDSDEFVRILASRVKQLDEKLSDAIFTDRTSKVFSVQLTGILSGAILGVLAFTKGIILNKSVPLFFKIIGTGAVGLVGAVAGGSSALAYNAYRGYKYYGGTDAIDENFDRIEKMLE